MAGLVRSLTGALPDDLDDPWPPITSPAAMVSVEPTHSQYPTDGGLVPLDVKTAIEDEGMKVIWRNFGRDELRSAYRPFTSLDGVEPSSSNSPLLLVHVQRRCDHRHKQQDRLSWKLQDLIVQSDMVIEDAASGAEGTPPPSYNDSFDVPPDYTTTPPPSYYDSFDVPPDYSTTTDQARPKTWSHHEYLLPPPPDGTCSSAAPIKTLVLVPPRTEHAIDLHSTIGVREHGRKTKQETRKEKQMKWNSDGPGDNCDPSKQGGGDDGDDKGGHRDGAGAGGDSGGGGEGGGGGGGGSGGGGGDDDDEDEAAGGFTNSRSSKRKKKAKKKNRGGYDEEENSPEEAEKGTGAAAAVGLDIHNDAVGAGTTAMDESAGAEADPNDIWGLISSKKDKRKSKKNSETVPQQPPPPPPPPPLVPGSSNLAKDIITFDALDEITLNDNLARMNQTCAGGVNSKDSTANPFDVDPELISNFNSEKSHDNNDQLELGRVSENPSLLLSHSRTTGKKATATNLASFNFSDFSGSAPPTEDPTSTIVPWATGEDTNGMTGLPSFNPVVKEEKQKGSKEPEQAMIVEFDTAASAEAVNAHTGGPILSTWNNGKSGKKGNKRHTGVSKVEEDTVNVVGSDAVKTASAVVGNEWVSFGSAKKSKKPMDQSNVAEVDATATPSLAPGKTNDTKSKFGGSGWPSMNKSNDNKNNNNNIDNSSSNNKKKKKAENVNAPKVNEAFELPDTTFLGAIENQTVPDPKPMFTIGNHLAGWGAHASPDEHQVGNVGSLVSNDPHSLFFDENGKPDSPWFSPNVDKDDKRASGILNAPPRVPTPPRQGLTPGSTPPLAETGALRAGEDEFDGGTSTQVKKHRNGSTKLGVWNNKSNAKPNNKTGIVVGSAKDNSSIPTGNEANKNIVAVIGGEQGVGERSNHDLPEPSSAENFWDFGFPEPNQTTDTDRKKPRKEKGRVGLVKDRDDKAEQERVEGDMEDDEQERAHKEKRKKEEIDDKAKKREDRATLRKKEKDDRDRAKKEKDDEGRAKKDESKREWDKMEQEREKVKREEVEREQEEKERQAKENEEKENEEKEKEKERQAKENEELEEKERQAKEKKQQQKGQRQKEREEKERQAKEKKQQQKEQEEHEKDDREKEEREQKTEDASKARRELGKAKPETDKKIDQQQQQQQQEIGAEDENKATESNIRVKSKKPGKESSGVGGIWGSSRKSKATTATAKSAERNEPETTGTATNEAQPPPPSSAEADAQATAPVGIPTSSRKEKDANRPSVADKVRVFEQRTEPSAPELSRHDKIAATATFVPQRSPWASSKGVAKLGKGVDDRDTVTVQQKNRGGVATNEKEDALVPGSFPVDGDDNEFAAFVDEAPAPKPGRQKNKEDITTAIKMDSIDDSTTFNPLPTPAAPDVPPSPPSEMVSPASKSTKKERPRIVRDGSSWPIWGTTPKKDTKLKEKKAKDDVAKFARSNSTTKKATAPALTRSSSTQKSTGNAPGGSGSHSSASEKDKDKDKAALRSEKRSPKAKGMNFATFLGGGSALSRRTSSRRESVAAKAERTPKDVDVDDTGLVSPPPEDEPTKKQTSAKAAKVLGTADRMAAKMARRDSSKGKEKAPGLSRSTKKISRAAPAPVDDDLVLLDEGDLLGDKPRIDLATPYLDLDDSRRKKSKKNGKAPMTPTGGDLDDIVMVDVPGPSDSGPDTSPQRSDPPPPRARDSKRASTGVKMSDGLMGFFGSFRSKPRTALEITPSRRGKSGGDDRLTGLSRRSRRPSGSEGDGNSPRRDERRARRSPQRGSEGSGTATEGRSRTDQSRTDAEAEAEARRTERRARRTVREAAEREAQEARAAELKAAEERRARRREAERQAVEARRAKARAEKEKQVREEAERADRRERERSARRAREAEATRKEAEARDLQRRSSRRTKEAMTSPGERSLRVTQRVSQTDRGAGRTSDEERRRIKRRDEGRTRGDEGLLRRSRRRSNLVAEPIDGYFDDRNGRQGLAPQRSVTEPYMTGGLHEPGTDHTSSWVNSQLAEPAPPPPIDGTVVEGPISNRRSRGRGGVVDHDLDDDEAAVQERRRREARRARRRSRQVAEEAVSSPRSRRVVEEDEGLVTRRRRQGQGSSGSEDYAYGVHDNDGDGNTKRRRASRRLTGGDYYLVNGGGGAKALDGRPAASPGESNSKRGSWWKGLGAKIAGV